MPTSRMRYEYVTAYRLVGGVNLLPNAADEVVLEIPTVKATFTLDQNRLSALDKAMALSNVLLDGIFRGQGLNSLPEAVDANADVLRRERSRKYPGATILLIEIHGEQDMAFDNPPYRSGDIDLHLQAVNKRAIRTRHEADLTSVLVGVGIASSKPLLVDKIADAVWFRDPSGRFVYVLNLTGSAEATSALFLSDDMAAAIRTWIALVRSEKDYTTLQRLLAQLFDFGNDRLRGFLYGWFALEIFTNKVYASFRKSGRIPRPPQGVLRRFYNHIKGFLIGDRPDTLSLRFRDISNTLNRSAEVTSDQAAFRKFKRLRDSVFHGERTDERSLPRYEIQQLVTRYLALRLADGNRRR